jgi:hypothetical protein
MSEYRNRFVINESLFNSNLWFGFWSIFPSSHGGGYLITERKCYSHIRLEIEDFINGTN